MPWTKSDPWSISFVYTNWQQFSRALGKGLSHHLLPDLVTADDGD